MAIFYYRIKTQFENLGDALINRELIRLMANNGNVYLETSNAPKKFLNQVIGEKYADNIQLINGPSFYLKLCLTSLFNKNKTYIFLNPGGYCDEISIQTLLQNHIKLAFLNLISMTGFQICQIGVSYTNLGPRHIKYLRKLSKILDFHAVRDRSTLSNAENERIRVDCILPDLALNLTNYQRVEKPKKQIFLSFRKNQKNENNILLESILEKSIRSFNLVEVGYQVEFDKNYSAYLCNKFNQKLSSPIDLTESIEKNIKYYSQFEYVFSNRLHVLILALVSGSIPIALIENTENGKIRGVFEYLELNEFVFDINGNDEINFSILMENILLHKKALKRQSQLLRRYFSSL